MITVPEELVDRLTEAVHRLLGGQSADRVELPPDHPDDEFRQLTTYLNRLIEEYDAFAAFLYALSRGELDRDPPRSGLKVVNSYKALQAHLRHLTWTAKRIADGDFTRRVDFMGEFSAAFNKMAADLADAFARIERQNAELSVLNAKLTRNVEDLTRAQRELAESEEKLATIVATASEAVVLIDARGLVAHWNPAAERMFGFPAAEIIGRPIQDHVAPPTERQLFLEYFPAFLESAGPGGKRLELTAMRRDGSLFPVEVSFASTVYAGQRHGLAIFRDVTERFKLEALKRDVDRMTRHDIKAPLTAIIGLPQIILETPGLDPEVAEMAGMIKDAGYAMLDMINLSLDLYKMETGTYILNPVPVDLLAATARVLAEQGPLARAKGLSTRLFLDREPAPEGAAFLVGGEKLLCYSLLSNLLKNALEASPQGGVVTLRFLSGAPMRLEIHNQGAIPAPIRETFFEKYVTSGKKHGTGLGAYSARLIARTQGGDIDVATSEEAGTTITVGLPPAVSL